MSKHERRAPFEQLRRNRLGDLWKLIENRYGSRVLPDDDAGRSDLFELLLVISLGERPAAKMQNTIETAAPWLSAEEAESMVAHITVALDRHERWCSPRVLGNRLNLRDRERQQYGIRHIRPIDVSDEELIDRRKAKARARERQRRLKSGGRSREDYLANSLSRQKPWLAQGMSRARWYRLKRETGACAMSLPLQRTDLSQPRMASMATVGSVTVPHDASNTQGHMPASSPPSTRTDLSHDASSTRSDPVSRKGTKPMENIKPTKSRSTPARLDNVSFFPSPIVSVDPFPDFPPLPDFLDRRKAKQATEAAA